ncbi:MAG: hypothetical protein V2I65_15935 [Paracoccaceae bacterium]|jgi:hypothetical protein|nr:hypothetical protein [Paracoccaceae bacterium]
MRNWNWPKFRVLIQPTGDGHASDFPALGRHCSVVLDRGGGRSTISDCKTNLVVIDGIDGGDGHFAEFSGGLIARVDRQAEGVSPHRVLGARAACPQLAPWLTGRADIARR